MARRITWIVITVAGLIFSFFAHVVNLGIKDTISKDAVWVGYALLALGLIWSAIGICKIIQKTKSALTFWKTDPKWVGIFLLGVVVSFSCWGLAIELKIPYFDYLAYVGGIISLVGFIQIIRKPNPYRFGKPHSYRFENPNDSENNSESEKRPAYMYDNSQKKNNVESVCNLCGGDGKCARCRFISEPCSVCNSSRKCTSCGGSGKGIF